MQKMSGAHLHFAVDELKGLSGKRIAKIRKTDEGIYLFKIGTDELLFEPGVRLHLTRQVRQATESPDGFVAFLRKNLEGKTAQRISQYGNDRIVEIETRSKERLIFELFRKGNLIYVGEDGTILSCLLHEGAGGRKIARGQKYCYPKATAFELKLPEKAAFAVQENEAGEPVSFSVDESQAGRAFPSFSEAADYYFANQKRQTEGQKAAAGMVKKLAERLLSQEQMLRTLAVQKEEAKTAGDAVYSEFEKIETLLSHVRKMKKEGRREQEINEWLSPHGAHLEGQVLELEC